MACICIAVKLEDTEVKFIFSDEIPSIHTTVILPSGQASATVLFTSQTTKPNRSQRLDFT
jgi:hypothetical protein